MNTNRIQFSTYLYPTDIELARQKLKMCLDDTSFKVFVDNNEPRPDWTECYLPSTILDGFSHLSWSTDRLGRIGLLVQSKEVADVNEVGIILKQLLMLEPETVPHWIIPISQSTTDMTPDTFGGGVLFVSRGEVGYYTTMCLISFLEGKLGKDKAIELLFS